MELLFAWIKEYKNIDEQSLSFSSRFDFECKIDSVEQTIVLYISESEAFIENFFGNNIYNVSAIVGANGVGKSNCLDFLIQLLSNGTGDLPYLVVFYNMKKKRIEIYHTLYDYEIEGRNIKPFDEWRVNVVNNSQNNIQTHILKPRFNHFYQILHQHVNALEKSRVIYYSPFLDFRTLPTMVSDAHEKIINISQQSLFREDINHAKYEEDILLRHKYENLNRQITFIDNNEGFISEIQFPSKLEVQFHKVGEIDQYDLGSNVKVFQENYVNNIRSLMSIANSLMDDNDTFMDGLKLKNKCWFLRNLLENFLFNLEKYTYIYDEKTLNINTNIDFQKHDFIDTLKFFFKKQTLISTSRFDFDKFIDFVISLMDDGRNLNHSQENEAILVLNTEIGKELLRFKQKYESSFPKKSEFYITSPFISFDWRNVSSGEKALLDVFSRIGSGIDQVDPVDVKNNLVYVLIDEGDISFHPIWQKQYLSKLLKFLTSKYQYNFQIILTTHSPYLVSDLPSGNVILLTGKDKLTSEIKLKTFGANIHELLADSFFMGDTLFGDFAYEKINQIFKWSRNEIELEVTYVKKLIELIDEPLLRYKLLQSYYEKIGVNKDEALIKAQIDSLNKKLITLQSSQNDSN